MRPNTSSGEIDRDTAGESIDKEPAENQFSSLNNPRCREILHLVADEEWITDQNIQDHLDHTAEQQREFLTHLANDGLVELMGTIEQQYIRLTPRGNWVADTQPDDTAETVEEAEG